MRGIAGATVVPLVALLGLGACAETGLIGHAGKNVMTEPAPSGRYKVGQPYSVNGRWYYPAEAPDYSAEGVASWYGPQFHGLSTANGELFDQNALTAAHTTLPMPSYVRVTNLENGRALVLRVNDRGPFVGDRIIDVSKRAAQLLGFMNKGTARVRVEAVAAPDDGTMIATRPAEPVGGVVLASVDTIGVGAGSGAIYVQAGAFGDTGRADTVRARLAPVGRAIISPVRVDGGQLFRVRLGPYANHDEAALVLARVRGLGFPEARLATD
ncbi:MAG: septal ring lytic transglycosylase RlpA family protein [Alphaproteobacteria bacterium]